MTMLLLGLDVGTSVIKAALFARDGQEVGEASVRTIVREPQPGWSELDPDTTWATAAGLCRTVLAQAGVGGDAVAAVSVTGAMVGAWLVDAAGGPLRPAILWNDTRARAVVDELSMAQPGLLSRVFGHSGSVMQLGCTLPVLAWLARHEPDVVARTKAVLTAKDYIRLRLTGTVATDETEAAVAPGSAQQRNYDPALFPLFGIDHLANLLPPVASSDAIAGVVTTSAAEDTGLRAGTPVAVGAGDTPACVIGAGVGSPGYACTVLGTTCLNGVVLDEPQFEPADLGLLFSVPGRLWMKTMVNIAGTTNLDWCLRALCPDLAAASDPFAELARLAEAGGLGAGGVTYVPHLSAGGIIAPRVEPGARGCFLGLEPRHDRTHLVRALYEGVALSIRDCFDAIGRPLQVIRLSGGGARSIFWSQLIADVTGVPVEVPAGLQFGAKGAAILAGVAIGWYGSVANACEATFRLKRRHDPDPASHAAYAAVYRRYRQVSVGCLDAVAPAYR